MIVGWGDYKGIGLLEADNGAPTVGNWDYYMGEGLINDVKRNVMIRKFKDHAYPGPQNWFFV
jgi:hypothetical protein